MKDIKDVYEWFKKENCLLLDTEFIDRIVDKIKLDLEKMTKKQVSFELINDYVNQAKAHLDYAYKLNINSVEKSLSN